MRKYKKSFNTMLISILLVVALYILKNIGSINQWNTELRILFYTCLIGINLIVLCLTLASKKDMDEILQYNPQGKAEKSKNRKYESELFSINYFMEKLWETDDENEKLRT